MKKLIYILVLSLFISSCSKSDDVITSEDNSINTFLEKYEGTILQGFDYNDNSQWLYFRFINDTNTPMEFWFEDYDLIGHSCWAYLLISSNDGYTLTENSINKLEWQYVESSDGVEYLEIFTISIIFDQIQQRDRFFTETKRLENGILVWERAQYYNESSYSVDDIILCD